MSKLLVNLLNQSTNSVTQMRSSVFLPYSNIENTNIYKAFVKNKNKGLFFQNEEFKLNIRNRLLGQSHRDILDVIFSQGLLKMTNKGQYYAEFTLYSILKKLGKSAGGSDRTWIKEKIQDLVDVVINLERLDGFSGGWSDIHILDKAAYSQKQQKYIIAFNSDYIDSFQSDIVINYNKYLPSILAIKNDTIKAFIRYGISNNWKNAQLDSILKELDISEHTMSKRQFNRIKKKIKDYDLSEFNISISHTEQILYRKKADIIFWNVATELKKASANSPVSNSKQANNILLDSSYNQASGFTGY
ncbi:hypothetical protein [Sulfurimonas hydrogeniphila]|uniref:hypothetical protein n=1 Tax=Sulfurimonas hydrogeniphila TaxID=2509341 RepID=UPI00125F1941|nr:hypothetical protein [Sulfurimonas hydrogeniphila]